MRSRSVVKRVLLIALLAPYLAPAQQRATYADAQQVFDAKNYVEAARLFGEVAAAETTQPAGSRSDALLMQARSLAKAGKYAAAEPVVRAYLHRDEQTHNGQAQTKRDARSAPALYLLGFVLESENKPRDSLEVFTQAAALATPRPEDLRLVALDYVLLEDYADAIRWLKRALADDPSNAEAWYDLGRANMHQGDFVASEHDFLRVLAIVPGEPRALNNLGLSYEAQNRTGEALSAYTRAVEAQKNSAGASEQPLLDLGALLNTKNRFDEAVAALQQAVAVNSNCVRCHEELSRALNGTGQLSEAIKQMESAVGLDAKNPSLHFELGRLYRQAGMVERAQSEFKVSANLYGNRSATIQEGQSSRNSDAGRNANDGKP